MDDYIEKQIEEVNQRDYLGEMPAHNKATLRRILEAEERFELRRLKLEEEGHSHSAVGDRFNQRIAE